MDPTPERKPKNNLFPPLPSNDTVSFCLTAKYKLYIKNLTVRFQKLLEFCFPNTKTWLSLKGLSFVFSKIMRLSAKKEGLEIPRRKYFFKWHKFLKWCNNYLLHCCNASQWDPLMRIKQHRSLPEAKTPIQNTTSRICNKQLTKKKACYLWLCFSWRLNFVGKQFYIWLGQREKK